MKNRNTFYNATSLALIAAMAAYVLIDPLKARSAASQGIELWARNVLPAVFPFFVLSGYIAKAGYANRIGGFFAPVMNKTLGISGIGAFSYITAIFSGTPLSIKTICDQYKEGRLERSEASILFALCSNIGPIFVLSTIGVSLFGSIEVGWMLLAINYLSAIITAFILSFRSGRLPLLSYSYRSKQAPPSRSKAFVEAVKESVSSVLNIGGFIMFFQVINSIWDSLIGSGKAKALNAFVAAFFEITAGSAKIAALKGESFHLSIVLVSAAISFGGLCIFFQCISFIADSDLKISDYLKTKVIQTIIGAVLGAFSGMLIPIELAQKTFYTISQEEKGAQTPYIYLVFLSFLIFSASCFLLDYIYKHRGSRKASH